MIGRPRDAVVRQGQMAEFSCQTNERETVNWNYQPRKSLTDVDIVTAGSLVQSMEDKFAVSIDDLGAVLILKNASMSDSGTYTCIDNLGLGERASAELILLGEEPENV